MRRTQTPQIPEPARAPGRLCCGPRETVTWALPLISFPCTRAQATDGVPAHCCTCHVQRWKGYGRCPRNSGGGPGRETRGRWVRGCPDGGLHWALQGTTQGAGEEADKLGAEEPVQRLLGDEDEEEPWEAGGGAQLQERSRDWKGAGVDVEDASGAPQRPRTFGRSRYVQERPS